MTTKETPCEMYTPKTDEFGFDCATCGVQSYNHATTYHVTSVTRGDVTLNAGDVIRLGSMINSKSAFIDAVILGFASHGFAKISRPYVYASCVGTTGATPLVGCETFEVSIESIVNYDSVVTTGRTT